MTFVGKVLIVLQVVLSLLFMAFAGAVYTTQQNWRANAKNLKVRAGELEKSIVQDTKDHETALTDLSKERDQEKERANNAEAKLKDASDRAISLAQELGLAKVRSSSLQQNSIAAISAESERRSEALSLRKTNSDLYKKIDQLVAKIRVLEENSFVSNRKTTAMLTKHTGMIKEFAKYKKVVISEGFDINAKKYVGLTKLPVNIEGKVEEVRKGTRSEPDLIMISIGKDDDLQKGHELFCYSKQGEGKYLGKIRIVYVTPDKAVGVVIQKAKNGTIKEGDYVSPKL